MKKILLTVFMLFLAFPAVALEVGETIPSFETNDSTGIIQNLSTITGENGAVLVFYRSAKWCPFCQRQLKDLGHQQKSFAKKGYTLVGISYDKTEDLAAAKKKYDIPFVLLSDEKSEIIKAFDILNTDFAEEHFAYGVPYPTIYVVDPSGVVQAVYAEEGYKKRPDPDMILEQLGR